MMGVLIDVVQHSKCRGGGGGGGLFSGWRGPQPPAPVSRDGHIGAVLPGDDSSLPAEMRLSIRVRGSGVQTK